MEGRVVRVADIIAYVNHDLDDALRAGVIDEDRLPASIIRLVGNTNSQRIGTMVKDFVYATLKEGGGRRLAMSPQILTAINGLRTFLYENVYETRKVHNDFIKAEKIIRELYDYFLTHDLPWEREEYYYDQEISKHRQVCDFIAGMTDRYALDLYTDIFLPKPWSVL